MNLRFIIGLALLLLVVTFTVQNVEIVTINFLFWKFSISRALMIFMLLVTGILIGWVSSGIRKR